jgi:hypothetical protein
MTQFPGVIVFAGLTEILIILAFVVILFLVLWGRRRPR